ncbi:V-type sodium ATPase catalytic subunit A [bioreactor metagenome]|uniref:V-type sodium ATPase catalytic subunit A n=1 Tax=bioreactor metagenome TaxID=1076179 RepID=A0A645GX31_9ZZZZ
MLKLVLNFYKLGVNALNNGVYLERILDLPLRDKIARSKYIDESKIDTIDEIEEELSKEIQRLIVEGGVVDV